MSSSTGSVSELLLKLITNQQKLIDLNMDRILEVEGKLEQIKDNFNELCNRLDDCKRECKDEYDSNDECETDGNDVKKNIAKCINEFENVYYPMLSKANQSTQ